MFSGCVQIYPVANVSTPTPDLNSFYQGDYQSGCIDFGGGLFLRFNLSIANGVLEEHFWYFRDSGAEVCTESSAFGKKFRKYSISVGDSYDGVVPGSKRISKVTKRLLVNQFSAFDNGSTDFVAEQNSDFSCSPSQGFSTWVAGVPQDVGGTSCAGDGDVQKSVGYLEYNFLDLDASSSPNALRVGDTDVIDHDGSSETKRPMSAFPITFYRL